MISLGPSRPDNIRNVIIFLLVSVITVFAPSPALMGRESGKLVLPPNVYRAGDIGRLELEVLAKSGEIVKGLNILKQIVRDRGSLNNYEKYLYSRLLTKSGNFREARKIATKISKRENDGYLRYVAFAEIKVAEAALDEASSLYGAAGDAGFSGGYYLSALSEMQLGNHRKARVLLSLVDKESSFFGRSIEKQSKSYLSTREEGKASQLIEDSLPLLPSLASVDSSNLLILLAKIYINDNKYEEGLRTAERLARHIEVLEKKTDHYAETYKEIETFPALSRVINPYLSQEQCNWAEEDCQNLTRLYVGWKKNSILLNTLLSYQRTALIIRNSIQDDLSKIDRKIQALEKKREEINRAETVTDGTRERMNRVIDDYPTEALYLTDEKKNIYFNMQDQLKKIEQMDIYSAKIDTLIDRVKNNPLYEKMDVGKVTAQKKAISGFFRLIGEINRLKTKAGIIQVRLVNQLKEPIMAEFARLERKNDVVRRKIRKTSELLKSLESRLYLVKKFTLLQLDVTNPILKRIKSGILFTATIDQELKKQYREASYRPLQAIKLYFREKRALLHYLRGRAYLHADKMVGGRTPSSKIALYDRAFEELKTAIDLGIEKEYRSECFYALAEILMAREEENFARKMEAFLRREEKGEVGTEPLITYSESLSYFNKIIADYPDSAYYENALYSYAYAKNEMGMVDDGTKIYEELIRKFPRTRYADEINMRIGEYYFALEDFQRAENAYRKVVGKKNRELKATSKFKLGWALYNQERYEEAVPAFVVPLKIREEGQKPKFARLAAESLNMIARCYIEMGKIRMIGEALEKAGLGPLIPAALLEEEKILFETSRFDDALSLANTLRDDHPYSIEIIDSEDIAANSTLKLLKEEDGYRRYYDTILLFGPESEWFQKNADNGEWLLRARDRLEENLRVAAYFFYKKGKETGDERYYREGIEIFRNYLKTSHDSPYATDIRYNLAHSLFEVGSYKSASRIFEIISSTDRTGKLGESALYMAVQCAKALYEPDHSDSVAEIIRITRGYLESFPEGERKAEITSDLASALFNGGMYEQTIAVTSDLEKETKEPELLSLALRLRGESYFHLGKFGKAEEAFRRLLTVMRDEKDKGKKSITKYIAFSIYKHAQRLRKNDDLSLAAKEYLRLFDEFPDLDFSPIAALEGGKALNDMGKWKEGKKIFEKVATAYAGSTYEKEARRQIALISEKIGDLQEAAKNYRLIGQYMEQDPEGATYLKKAASLLFEMGSYEDAGNTFARLESNRQITTGLKIEAAYFSGVSFIKFGDRKKGIAYLNRAVLLSKSAPGNDKNIYFASLSQLEITMTDFDEYRNIKIREPFEDTFSRKEKGLNNLLDSYVDIAKYGIPETLSASLYQIGEAYEEFRNAILSAPIPPGLSSVEQEEYIFLLEEKAAPYEEEAAKSHAKNVKKAAKVGYVNSWVRKSWDKLKEMRGATFGRKPANPLIIVPKGSGDHSLSLREVKK